MTGIEGTSSDLKLEVWRLRDLFACIGGPLVVPPDASPTDGGAVPYGVVPLAYAHASATFGVLDGQLAGWHAQRHRPGPAVEIAYYEPAEIGSRLTIELTGGEAAPEVALRTAAGRPVADVRRSWPAEHDGPPAVSALEPLDLRRLDEEDFHRVRLARWACTAGDLDPYFCDHEFALERGLPGCLVPESLVLAITERWLTRNGTVEVSAVSFHQYRDVYAGDCIEISAYEVQENQEEIIGTTSKGEVVFHAGSQRGA